MLHSFNKVNKEGGGERLDTNLKYIIAWSCGKEDHWDQYDAWQNAGYWRSIGSKVNIF